MDRFAGNAHVTSVNLSVRYLDIDCYVLAPRRAVRGRWWGSGAPQLLELEGRGAPGSEYEPFYAAALLELTRAGRWLIQVDDR